MFQNQSLLLCYFIQGTCGGGGRGEGTTGGQKPTTDGVKYVKTSLLKKCTKEGGKKQEKKSALKLMSLLSLTIVFQEISKVTVKIMEGEKKNFNKMAENKSHLPCSVKST